MSIALEYIESSWERCVCKRERQEGPLIALPYPFVPPSPSGETMFPNLYYWDTYFSNLGLISAGRYDLAEYNIRNIAWLINKYGFMPNGAADYFLNRSQPPFFAKMLRSLYECSGNSALLEEMLPYAECEYAFWQNKRITDMGLNCYGSSASKDEKIRLAIEVAGRLKIIAPKDLEVFGAHMTAEAESGWDFCKRFEAKALDWAPIDLNSLLYYYELFLAEFTGKLQYMAAAAKRKKLINKYCLGSDGIYYDYNFIEKRRSDLKTCAGFWPYWMGVSNDKKGASKLLSVLELNKGLTCVEKLNFREIIYQWDYPNMWAPLVFGCCKALEICGLNEDANRVARKFINTVDVQFIETGYLWEKYDAETGFKTECNEYPLCPMLGWTAGVYAHLYKKYYKV